MRVLTTVLAAVILVAGCRSAGSAPSGPSAGSLVGTSWMAEEIDGQGVVDRVQSTLTFENLERISGSTACNRYFGSFELGGNTLRLKPAGTTRMACPPPVMEQETKFLTALGAVTAYRRDADRVLLVDDSGRVRVRLVPFAPARSARDRFVG
jgi:heat shock protein HslJ